MATHGLWQSLPERVGRLEATIESLIRENERLRTQVANAHEAEEILRRAQAPPPVPQPRSGHRRKRDRTITYLRVVRVALPFAAAAFLIAGAVNGASSITASPAAAGTSFAGMEQDHVDAAEAGLCRGQLPEVGEWPGSDALVESGRSPFGMVAFGGDAARAIAGGWCDTSPRR